jgi:hypothetical protein
VTDTEQYARLNAPRGRGAEYGSGVTERGWWTAARESWAHPREWSALNIVALATLVVLLAVAAIWVTRPGQLLGGAESLNAGRLYTDDASGRYVYQLLEPPAGPARMQATLQSIYDAHKAAAPDGGLTIILIGRAASETPYITGTAQDSSNEVLGRVVVGPDSREAAARRTPEAPLEPVSLDW